MSARSGGSFAALLMSGPLAAIPLMAVFGVPQFTSGTASMEPEPAGVLRRPQVVATEPTGGSEQTAVASIDETPFNVPRDVDRPPGSTPLPTRVPRPDTSVPLRPTEFADGTTRPSFDATTIPAAQHISSTERREPLLMPESSGLDSTPPQQARPTPTTLTTTPASVTPPSPWENAAQKLQELGIDDYRLERGMDGDTFVFICQFAPGADTRIIRRFEAEAIDAASAVQHVLQQITDWQLSSSTY